MSRLVRVERRPIAQPYKGIVVAELHYKGRPYTVAIDYSDYLDNIDSNCARQAAIYFKMQYRRDGYNCDRVIPGGYVNRSPRYLKYLSWIRSVQAKKAASFDVYGRFSLDFAGVVRERAVNLLQKQAHFRYEGSLRTVRYLQSLEEAAVSRVCIDLPGNGDFCFRLIDYLGIGACVVAAPHRTTLHVPLEDRTHIIYAKEDLSDLVSLCKYYLEHDVEREAIMRNSRMFFDRYLHPQQLAGYYLSKCLDVAAGT